MDTESLQSLRVGPAPLSQMGKPRHSEQRRCWGGGLERPTQLHILLLSSVVVASFPRLFVSFVSLLEKPGTPPHHSHTSWLLAEVTLAHDTASRWMVGALGGAGWRVQQAGWAQAGL